MIIKYEFNTQAEDFDYSELYRIQNVDMLVYTINRINDKLRDWYKYDNRGSIPIEEVYEEITSIISENIDIDKF